MWLLPLSHKQLHSEKQEFKVKKYHEVQNPIKNTVLEKKDIYSTVGPEPEDILRMAFRPKFNHLDFFFKNHPSQPFQKG